MCGLVGQIYAYKNGFDMAALEQFGHMMFLNQLRGADSTGVVGIGKDQDYWWIRGVGGWDNLRFNDVPGWKGFEDPLFQKGKIAFGHGRQATRGAVTVANAHPFVKMKPHGKKNAIILVHNGTLQAHQTLKGMDEFEVDSEWLTDQIATLGAEEALSKVNGAIATQWYDSEHKTFNIYRNEDRPLFAMKSKMGDWFINSEIPNLLWLKLKHKIITEEDLVQFEAGTLYTWSVPDTEKLVKTKITHSYGSYYSGWTEGEYYGMQPSVGYRGRGGPSVWGNRDLIKDMHAVVNGEYKKIIFDDRGRHTHNKDGTIVHDKTAPYELHLIQIDSPDISMNRINKYYEMQGTKWTVEVHRLNGRFEPWIVPAVRVEPKGFPEEPDALEEELKTKSNVVPIAPTNRCIDVHYKAGKEIKFTTPVYKGTSEVITHKAICHKDHLYYFSSYENNADGRIRVGDRIKVEVEETESCGKNKLTRAVGSRLAERMDAVVDCVFFAPKWTPEQVTKMRFFEGTVALIQIASKDHHEKRRVYIEVRLNDIIPCVSLPANEVSSNTH